MYSKISSLLLLTLLFLFLPSAFAAKIVNLHQPLLAFTSLPLQETSRQLDFNHTLHIRLQEMYAGHPVWGANAVMHIPRGENRLAGESLTRLAATQNSWMNGLLYQDLNTDLQNTPAVVFTAVQAGKAFTHIISSVPAMRSQQKLSDKQSQLIVYIDKNKIAHWAYLIQFRLNTTHGLPVQPHYIVDALTLKTYQRWDNLQTSEAGGGLGGNKKIGQLIYDGLAGHYPPLTIHRDITLRRCYLENPEVVVNDARETDTIEQYPCEAADPKHNFLFWDGAQGAVNGAYSPGNDALFVGNVIQAMYKQWYGIPPLTRRGKPMRLQMFVHDDMDNAYWDGSNMVFGDGVEKFYPLVSLGIGAHEISHGFTQQHANLTYMGQSGGLNESFSDMAAQAAEFFTEGKSSWQMGSEVMKEKNKALRYMDHPTKDCAGGAPGVYCSIENIKDYAPELDVHYSSGIYNRVFYLLATAPGWDTRKAFNVMVQANMYYWTPNVTFAEAACGVMRAAKDYGYVTKALEFALAEVGIIVGQCS